MHFTKVFALAALFATGVFANPIAEPEPGTRTKPTKRPKPTQVQVVNQSNVCGNGVAPFCCISDNSGKTSCKAMDNGSICQTTVVCCNAQDSVQVCLGNVNVIISL